MTTMTVSIDLDVLATATAIDATKSSAFAPVEMAAYDSHAAQQFQSAMGGGAPAVDAQTQQALAAATAAVSAAFGTGTLQDQALVTPSERRDPLTEGVAVSGSAAGVAQGGDAAPSASPMPVTGTLQDQVLVTPSERRDPLTEGVAVSGSAAGVAQSTAMGVSKSTATGVSQGGDAAPSASPAFGTGALRGQALVTPSSRRDPLEEVAPNADALVAAGVMPSAVSASASSPAASSEIAAVEAASARTVLMADGVARTLSVTEVLVAAAEAVADAILVTPGLMRGEGEVRIQLRPDVLDGTEVRIAVQGRMLDVAFVPQTSDMAALIEQCRPQLEQHLAGRIHAFQIAVAVKPSLANGRGRLRGEEIA